VFLINDVYGFISWNRMKTKQISETTEDADNKDNE